MKLLPAPWRICVGGNMLKDNTENKSLCWVAAYLSGHNIFVQMRINSSAPSEKKLQYKVVISNVVTIRPVGCQEKKRKEKAEGKSWTKWLQQPRTQNKSPESDWPWHSLSLYKIFSKAEELGITPQSNVTTIPPCVHKISTFSFPSSRWNHIFLTGEAQIQDSSSIYSQKELKGWVDITFLLFAKKWEGQWV